MTDVELLRRQLRERGYLSHGIERWFALDPWSSRTFWAELGIVCVKGATLLALFAALPLVAVMLFRNHPLSPLETLVMTLLYGAAAFAIAFVFLAAVALVLRLRPALALDTPRALLVISFAAAAALTAPIAVWWYRFDTAPAAAELCTGIALIAAFFVVASIVVSASMLSFSIYELQRVPAIHQKPRGAAMTVAAALLIALLFIPAYAAQERSETAPPQIVTTPTSAGVALLAVDGLTYEILHARPDLAGLFTTVAPVRGVPGASTTERWASIGTGVPTQLHGVRAIEGVRLAGGAHVLQTLSRADVVLRDAAELLHLARREPLPPTVRKRDYAWEVFASRGIPAASVNWWATEDASTGALRTVGQPAIFARTTSGTSPENAALAIDAATERAAESLGDPRFLTLYLPSLDVLLNRLGLDQSTQLATSVRALDQLKSIASAWRARGYTVLLLGLPGDGQRGAAVLASTSPLPVPPRASAYDLAPTLCTLFGFPATNEMRGTSLVAPTAPRIATFGSRATKAAPASIDREYYENLKSLGYIK